MLYFEIGQTTKKKYRKQNIWLFAYTTNFLVSVKRKLKCKQNIHFAIEKFNQ